MDYTRVNLDLVDSGQIFAVVGQPLYEECKGAAELLYKMANGEEVPYWTVLEAPLITKDDLAPWYELLDRMEDKMRPTPAPEAAEKVTGKFYYVQNTAWHPVHQLTQLSFLEGCEELGLDCELATTDEGSLESFLAVAEQAVDRPDAKGVVMWAGGLPVVAPIIEEAKEKGIAVVLPHFPVPEGSFADNAVQIAADTTKYPDPVAKAMCEQLEGQTGSVAVTQNNFNATEDMVAKVFTESMNKYCPDITVLAPQEEGPEPTQAIAKAVSIMQANPDLIGALSTTGGGPTTWAGAQKETGKAIVAIGMDYTRVNLDLVDSGQVFAVVGQPLYDRVQGCSGTAVQDGQRGRGAVLDGAGGPADHQGRPGSVVRAARPDGRQDAPDPGARSCGKGNGQVLLCAEHSVAPGPPVDPAVVPGRMRGTGPGLRAGHDGRRFTGVVLGS